MTSIVPLMCVCMYMKNFLSFLSHLTFYMGRKGRKKKHTRNGDITHIIDSSQLLTEYRLTLNKEP